MTDDDPGPVPDPAPGSDGERRVAAVAAALPLAALAERGDPDAFAAALRIAVSDPEDAGLVVYGLTELVRFALSMPALHGPERLEMLDGMLVDLAAGR